MRSPMVLASVAVVALAAACILILKPTLIRSLIPSATKDTTEPTTQAKKTPRTSVVSAHQALEKKRIKQIESILVDDDQAVKKKQVHPLAQMSPLAATPASPKGTIVFEPVTLRTAEVFAKLKQQCRKRDCSSTYQMHLEKQKIHDRILRDAAKACRNQQLDGCQIQARLLDYAGEVLAAKNAMQAGRNIAERVVKSCSKKPLPDCSEASANQANIDAALKVLDKKLIEAH